MRATRNTGELRAYLSDSVTEGDHVIEAASGEGAEMLGRSPTDVDSPLRRYADGVGMERLGMASGATGLDLAAREPDEKGFGDLRAGAVAGAEKKDTNRSTRCASRSFREGRRKRQGRVESAARCGQ
jgi:hypothetical protein